MAMRSMRARTQHDYVRHVRAFTAFLGRSPDTATAEEVRRFQVHQREHGAGETAIGAAVSALRFLFTVTLDRPDLSRRLMLAPRPRKLTDVLSVEDGGQAARQLTLRARLYRGRRHLPRCRSCVSGRSRRPPEPRPAQRHAGHRTLPHRRHGRACRGLPRLRALAGRLQQLPQPALSAVPGRGPAHLARRARSRPPVAVGPGQAVPPPVPHPADGDA